MSEKARDWRVEAGLVRFPEDNDVIGVPIDAQRRELTTEEKETLTFIEIAVGQYGYEHPHLQGKDMVVWHEPGNGTKYILGIPYETPHSI